MGFLWPGKPSRVIGITTIRAGVDGRRACAYRGQVGGMWTMSQHYVK